MRKLLLLTSFFSIAIGVIIFLLASNKEFLDEDKYLERGVKFKSVDNDIDSKTRNITIELTQAFEKIVKPRSKGTDSVIKIINILDTKKEKFEMIFIKLSRKKKQELIIKIESSITRQLILLEQVKDAGDFEYAQILDQKIMYNQYRLDIAKQTLSTQ